MKVLRLNILCLLMLLFSPGTLAPESGRKILVINSDASVEKYAAAQTEFKNSLALPVRELDLSDREWKLEEIEEVLYDEYPDLVYCIGTKAYLVANRFISEKDVVFSSIINWQRLPLTQNTYGVSNEMPPEMQVTLFRHIFPKVRKIGVLYSEEYNGQWMDQAVSQVSGMGVELIGVPIRKSGQAVSALGKLLEDVDAVWLISDPVVLSEKNTLVQIFETCDARKVPIFSYHDAFAEQGAALIVSVDNATIGRQAAGIAAEVIHGEEIVEKAQFPAGTQIILNLKKVNEYGLDYNEEALASVNRIIE